MTEIKIDSEIVYEQQRGDQEWARPLLRKLFGAVGIAMALSPGAIESGAAELGLLVASACVADELRCRVGGFPGIVRGSVELIHKVNDLLASRRKQNTVPTTPTPTWVKEHYERRLKKRIEEEIPLERFTESLQQGKNVDELVSVLQQSLGTSGLNFPVI